MISEVTVECTGPTKLLVDVLLKSVDHLSIEPCMPPPEPDLDIKGCLDNYKTLAFQFLGYEMMDGSKR